MLLYYDMNIMYECMCYMHLRYSFLHWDCAVPCRSMLLRHNCDCVNIVSRPGQAFFAHGLVSFVLLRIFFFLIYMRVQKTRRAFLPVAAAPRGEWGESHSGQQHFSKLGSILVNRANPLTFFWG